MKIKDKIEILKKQYPPTLDNQHIPHHIVQLLGTYEETGGLTSKMRIVLDKVIERILKDDV